MKDRSVFMLCLFVLIPFANLFAQEPLHRHFSKNEGLPSSTIFQMLQDQDGFIWFGTDVGVSRFDGTKFQHFTIADGLSDNYILNVKTDSKGRIWFLGFNGTASYWLKGKIYNASSDTLLKNIRSTNSFIDLFEDNKHRIWFISINEYLILDKHKTDRFQIYTQRSIVFNGKSGQIIIVNKMDQPLLRSDISLNIHFITPDYQVKHQSGYWRCADGSILFISNEGVIRQNDTLQKLFIPFHGAFKNSRMGSMTLSKDSLLWIAVMGKGLYCYDLKNPEIKPIIYLKNKITVSVLEDKEGNIWISTLNEGLYMIPLGGRKVKIFDKENGLLNNQVYALFKQKADALLIGLNEGKIQLIANAKTSEYKTVSCNDLNNKIHRIVSRNDDVWIASECGVIHKNAKTGCNHFLNDGDRNQHDFYQLTNVKDITLSDPKIYIACGSRIFEYPVNCKINSGYWATNIKEKQIRNYSIYSDHNKQLWYGTIKGLHSKKDNSFFDHSKEDILLTHRINCITETEDSVLVLATHGYGVLFYKHGKIINRITVAEGLCNDICRKVFVHKNRMYVSTPSGVSVLSYSKGIVQSVQNMNTGNFLPSNDVNDVYADDREISVATMEGLAILDLSAIEKIKSSIPLLHITEIRLNDSIITYSRETIFPYDENNLKINFIGICYQQPDEVSYTYKMKDNQPWQTTKNTNLEFFFLPPGNYKFQLKAHLQNGDWSPVQTFSFSITPPFWNTLKFGLAAMLFVLFLVYLLVKQRLKINRKKHEEKIKTEKQITGLEQQALQTMMNPHFIFNVMNSIQHFINDNEKDAANKYLADFAKLIRMNLTISYKRFIPLEEEINYLQLYLSFEKLRFGDKLTYNITVDPTIDRFETTVAVMMIQPFIENAIWYGILPKKTHGYIQIKIDKAGEDLLKVSIEDNGIGIHEAFVGSNLLEQKNESHGLSITLQRLKLLGKSAGQELFVRFSHVHPELENKGTIVEFNLPSL
ncbi:MAG: histidine kinase [Bacteroidota bacterium]|nr:histidine kinase [Bacteroidota bacterium]